MVSVFWVLCNGFVGCYVVYGCCFGLLSVVGCAVYAVFCDCGFGVYDCVCFNSVGVCISLCLLCVNLIFDVGFW